MPPIAMLLYVAARPASSQLLEILAFASVFRVALAPPVHVMKTS